MSRLDHHTPPCSEPNCDQMASIIHSGVPYCGKHALAKWRLEEEAASARRIKRTELAATNVTQ